MRSRDQAGKETGHRRTLPARSPALCLSDSWKGEGPAPTGPAPTGPAPALTPPAQDGILMLCSIRPTGLSGLVLVTPRAPMGAPSHLTG